MSLKLKYPACGAEVSLAAMSQANELLALSRAMESFRDDWPLVSEYLELFRPQSGKPLQVKKLLRLAREVFLIWQTGYFEFKRAPYRVGREEFLAALRATCNQVTPPLSNHHYLLREVLRAVRQAEARR